MNTEKLKAANKLQAQIEEKEGVLRVLKRCEECVNEDHFFRLHVEHRSFSDSTKYIAKVSGQSAMLLIDREIKAVELELEVLKSEFEKL